MTLREALAVLEAENVGDFIYDIRDRAAEGDQDYSGERWEHPRVLAWAEACKTIGAWLKENPV